VTEANTNWSYGGFYNLIFRYTVNSLSINILTQIIPPLQTVTTYISHTVFTSYRPTSHNVTQTVTFCHITHSHRSLVYYVSWHRPSLNMVQQIAVCHSQSVHVTSQTVNKYHVTMFIVWFNLVVWCLLPFYFCSLDEKGVWTVRCKKKKVDWFQEPNGTSLFLQKQSRHLCNFYHRFGAK
jgi:hypothetical protein